MIHHTAFAADGTALAYRLSGLPPASDTPAIVCVNGYLTSDFYWVVPRDRLQARATFLTWDYKGHGLSGPAQTPQGTTVQAMVDDMIRVMDHAGVEKAVLVGFSMGCQVILEAWRAHPDRISALVPMFGPHGYMLDYALHPLLGRLFKVVLDRMDDRLFSLLLRLGGVAMGAPFTFEIGKALSLIGAASSREQIDQFAQHFLSIHGPTVKAIGASLSRHTAEDHLGTVSVPSLVLAGGKDTFCPPHLSRRTHDLMVGSELLMLPDLNHTALFEAPDQITDAFIDFLERRGILAKV